MTNWKGIAVFGGVGFLLALLFGIVAGNPFGVVLLRVLLSTVAAGGLGFGIFFVVERFLPEISAGGTAERPAGGRVDIVLPEENPHAGAVGRESASVFSEDEAVSEAAGDPEADAGIGSVEELGPADEVSPEASDPRSAASGDPGSAGYGDPGSEEGGELGQAEAGDPGSPGASDHGSSEASDHGSGGFGDLGSDAEPETLEAAVEESSSSGSRARSAAAGGLDTLGGRPGTVNAGGQQLDPEVVARAVRTMMKRDGEG
jgi:hypothetical protein